MSNENSPPQTPPSPSNRRASFAPGQKISELFGRSPAGNGNAAGISAYPGPIAAAAANAQAQQRRRMSVSTLGLSGSPTQTPPFASMKGRRESNSSASTGSPNLDESAVEEGDAASNNPPSSPFARRMSFGARALRDVKTGSFNGRASTNLSSPHSTEGRGLSLSFDNECTSKKWSNHTYSHSGEGFNWSEQLRSRAQRSSSTANATNQPLPAPPNHQRAATVASVEPQKAAPKTPQPPDHFQERILKGDFYMD
ncbi:hypothetical protein MMC20_002865 [Loxospora ochrophaea]|nr:hypothetical protein [Loxospora ochrophaea]